MSKREFFRVVCTQYFIIVTLINVVMFALGMIYRPNDRLEYDAFLAPLIYAAFSMLPVILTYSRKELSVKQMIVRMVLNLLAIEGIMIICVLGTSALVEQPLVVAGFAFSVFLVYILVIVISWILDLGQARQMNIDLENYKRGIQD